VASGANAVVQVTGKASTNIRWTVSVHVTQTQSY